MIQNAIRTYNKKIICLTKIDSLEYKIVVMYKDPTTYITFKYDPDGNIFELPPSNKIITYESLVDITLALGRDEFEDISKDLYKHYIDKYKCANIMFREEVCKFENGEPIIKVKSKMIPPENIRIMEQLIRKFSKSKNIDNWKQKDKCFLSNCKLL